MKDKFEYARSHIEIILFEPADIVTASGNIEEDGNVDYSGGWRPTDGSW